MNLPDIKKGFGRVETENQCMFGKNQPVTMIVDLGDDSFVRILLTADAACGDLATALSDSQSRLRPAYMR